MFATRRDQENLAHLHHTTTKPLHQGVTRTPAQKGNLPRTPYRRHDENAAHTTSKAGAGKAAANLFVTPAPDRSRAVLGAKTTNAKALATPGQALKTTQKPAAVPSAQKISPRLKRNRVRVHQAPESKTDIDEDDSAPEIEYCPPPGVCTPPLADYPDNFHELPLKEIFGHENIMASIFRDTSPERDDNGLTAADRAFRASIKELDHDILRKIDAQDLLYKKNDRSSTGATSRQSKLSQPSTLSSRSAAVALSSTRPQPSFAAPTKAANARVADTAVASKHFSTAKAASRTTVGYARGRQVSATKRAPLSNAHLAPVVKKTSPVVADKARPRVAHVLGLDDEDDSDGLGVDHVSVEKEQERRLRRELLDAAAEEFVLEL